MNYRLSYLLKFCFLTLFLSFSSFFTPLYCQSPTLDTFIVPNDSTITLIFQQPILLPSRLNFSNLWFDGNNRYPSHLTLASDERTLTLTFPLPFPEEQEMSLLVGNVIDKNSNDPLFPIIYPIRYSRARMSDYFGKVVFSELMFRPGPNTPLPNAEYIELRNLTKSAIDLSRWSLMRGSDYATLGNNTFPPNTYLLIVPSSKDSLFESYTNVIAPYGFNALRNDGDTLTLRDHLNRTVATMHYSPQSFGTSALPPHGTSIEVIDETNLSGSLNNWSASIAPLGGTPNALNSVARYNPDPETPSIASLTYPTDYSLTIRFSHSIRIEDLCNSDYFTPLTNTPTIAELRPLRPLSNALTILFTEPLQQGRLYSIQLSPLTSFTGIQTPATTIEFELPRTPVRGDVIINEILHSPHPNQAPFVELFNTSSFPIDLSALSLGYIQQSSGKTLLLPITTERTALPPLSYVAITPSEENIRQHYPSDLPRLFLTPDKMPTLYANEGTLLLCANQEEFERVNYASHQHASMLTSTKGIALERITPSQPATAPSNWCSASFLTNYATPGLPNSAASSSPNADRFQLLEQHFSPNNDGHLDHLSLLYSLPPNSVISIYIFNGSADLVHTLMRTALVSGSGSFEWNGETNNNRPLTIGMYIMQIEWQADNGEAGRSRLPFVVSRR